MRLLFFVLVGVIVLGCSENSESEGISSDSFSSFSSSSFSSSRSSSSSGTTLLSSSSEAILSSSSSEVDAPYSSNEAGISSSSSSEVATLSSSSSAGPLPAGQYERLTSSNSLGRGWASRYWDGCKPHCSHRENVDTTAVPFTVCRNCDKNNQEIAAFTISPNANQWWTGYEGTKNSCEGGIAYTCFDMAPVKINDTLSYGFAAAPGSEAACGQCFQLQFDGRSKSDDNKEAHTLIKGKTLIILASNIGHDVEKGQFDILIPGGGVGAYDSFSNLLGVSKDQLGVTFGGFLSTCQQTTFNHDYNLPAERYKECVAQKCNEIFGRDQKFADLLRGCLWFADWYEAADNPSYLYKKVECPDYLAQKYRSTIHTTKDTDLRPLQ
jgi:hypothetical protein